MIQYFVIYSFSNPKFTASHYSSQSLLIQQSDNLIIETIALFFIFWPSVLPIKRKRTWEHSVYSIVPLRNNFEKRI